MKIFYKYGVSVVLISCILFLSPVLALADTSQEVLTVDQALNMAYQKSPDLRMADLDVRKAEINKDDAAEKVGWVPAGGLILPAYQQIFNGYQQAEIGYNTAKKTQDYTRDQLTQSVVNAYAGAVQNYNNMELARLTLEDMKEQNKMRSLAKEIGLVSNIDYEKSKIGLKQTEEQLKYNQSQYEGSIATLRSLLGKDENWNPKLTSKAIINDYTLDDISMEISRGLSESVQVWSKEAQRNIELSKQSWVIPNLSTKMQNVNVEIAEVDYQQAQQTSRASIEKLYYTIDSLEGQIKATEEAYLSAQKDGSVARNKYELGMLSRSSLTNGGESLSSYQLAEEKSRVSLENMKASLAQSKAAYALLTGRNVYESKDWAEAGK